MKYYTRQVTKREAINKFGKLGYVLYNEYVKTNNIEKYNFKKHHKFYEDEDAKKYLYHLKKDIVYCEKA